MTIQDYFWDFAYFYEYGHQYLTYLPQKILSKPFFRKKVWLRNTLPTYGLDICPNFCSFFFWKALLIQQSQFISSNNLSLTQLYLSLSFAHLSTSLFRPFCVEESDFEELLSPSKLQQRTLHPVLDRFRPRMLDPLKPSALVLCLSSAAGSPQIQQQSGFKKLASWIPRSHILWTLEAINQLVVS